MTSELDGQFIEKYRDSCLREFVTEIAMLKDQVRGGKWRENEHASCEATIHHLRIEISRLEALLRESRSRMTVHEREVTSPIKGEGKTSISPSVKRPRDDNPGLGSQSDVEAYGANFGDYVDSDPNGAGMIYSRRDHPSSYASNVEGPPRDLANSTATYRSSQVINSVSSAQHIRIEGNSGKVSVELGERYGVRGGTYNTSGGSSANSGKVSEHSGGRYAGGGTYNSNGGNLNQGSSYDGNGGNHNRNGGNLSESSVQRQGGSGSEIRHLSSQNQGDAGNGVQITTSRITTDQGEHSSGQVSMRQESSYVAREGATTSTTGTKKYQFHEKKYERTTRE